ncbi:MAG: pyridoxamine 5'-phosphate oxidase family protein [Bacteroidota bacterium]
MKLSKEIKASLDKSVLAWLATASKEAIPNVSPKEIFTHFGQEEIIIANIASPQSLKNIWQNEHVCLSFVDILVQKGFQLRGKARIIKKTEAEFAERAKVLLKMTGGKFPFSSLTQIKVEQAKPILAPRYLLFPDTTEAEQIASAKKAYGF